MAEHDNFIIVRLSIFLSVFIRVPVCLSFCLSLCLSVFCHTLSETNVKKKKKKNVIEDFISKINWKSFDPRVEPYSWKSKLLEVIYEYCLL